MFSSAARRSVRSVGRLRCSVASFIYRQLHVPRPTPVVGGGPGVRTPSHVPRLLATPPSAAALPHTPITAEAGGLSAWRAAGTAAGPSAAVHSPLLPAPVCADIAAAPARRRVRASAQQKHFLAERVETAKTLYDRWNAEVFGGKLPADLPLVWNARLASTAGQVLDDGSQDHTKAQPGQKVPCRLELSPKLLTSLAKLRTTLAHEMCHVAAWAVDHEFAPPHGPAFWRWAEALMSYENQRLDQHRTQQLGGHAAPAVQPPAAAAAASAAALATPARAKGAKGAGSKLAGAGLAVCEKQGRAAGRGEEDEELGPLEITRLHNFETHMPYRWKCVNMKCGKMYQRHRQSIDPVRHVCAKCKSRLEFLGKFSKDNRRLNVPSRPSAGVGARLGSPGANTARPGSAGSRQLPGAVGGGEGGRGAPCTPQPTPNAYRVFVKAHYADAKAQHPPGTPMADVMKTVAAKWAAHKQQTAAGRGAAPATPAATAAMMAAPLPAATPLTLQPMPAALPASHSMSQQQLLANNQDEDLVAGLGALQLAGRAPAASVQLPPSHAVQGVVLAAGGQLDGCSLQGQGAAGAQAHAAAGVRSSDGHDSAPGRPEPVLVASTPVLMQVWDGRAPVQPRRLATEYIVLDSGSASD